MGDVVLYGEKYLRASISGNSAASSENDTTSVSAPRKSTSSQNTARPAGGFPSIVPPYLAKAAPAGAVMAPVSKRVHVFAARVIVPDVLVDRRVLDASYQSTENVMLGVEAAARAQAQPRNVPPALTVMNPLRNVVWVGVPVVVNSPELDPPWL